MKTYNLVSPSPRAHTRQKGWGTSGFFALVAAMILTVFTLSSGAAKEADGFFQTNATMGPDAAWRRASGGFRTAISAREWAVLSKSRGLNGYAGASWNRRFISDQGATLGGIIKLNNGDRAPAEVTLVKDKTVWQVQSVAVGRRRHNPHAEFQDGVSGRDASVHPPSPADKRVA